LENVEKLFKSASSVNFCLTQLNLRGWKNVSDWLVCLNKNLNLLKLALHKIENSHNF